MQETDAVGRTGRSIVIYTHSLKISRVHYFISKVLQVALRGVVILCGVSLGWGVSYGGIEAESVPGRN